MARISRQQLFMGIARLASQRATCFRLNVGALVVQDNNPIALGYNGQEPGATHCAGNDCPGIVPGKCGTLHAEHNALTKASKILLSESPASFQPPVDLYVTHSPCVDCCLLIMNQDVHVHRIFFEVPYRSTQHLGMLQEYPCPVSLKPATRHTEVYEVTPAGYIVEYFSRKVVELP